MKSTLKYKLLFNQTLHKMFVVRLLFFMLIFTSTTNFAIAQEGSYTKSSWWFGTAGGVNYNLYHGSVQALNADVNYPITMANTKGSGLFAFPIVEYHKQGSHLGFMLHTGYESRRGPFNDALSTKLAYFTFEPSIRLNLFNTPFYLYSGPRIAFNVDKRFDGGLMSDMKKSIISMQIGGGYDLSLTPANSKNQVIISPFVAFHPYFGQNPRTIESWNITTLRAGIALKFGKSRKVDAVKPVLLPVFISSEPEYKLTEQNFSITDTEKQIAESNSPENHIYFDLRLAVKATESQELIKDDIELTVPEELLKTKPVNEKNYQNLLSILGSQMIKDPTSTITLIESSTKVKIDATLMADAIKTYLVGVFGINSSRISTQILKNPESKSGKTKTSQQIGLLLEGDLQVSIVSRSSALMNEIMKDPALRSSKIFTVKEAPADSYITFKVKGQSQEFSSWSMEITDPYGKIKNFGPFKQSTVSMKERMLIGTGPEGNYDITIIGKTKDGKIEKKETSTFLKLWTPPSPEKSKRFSVIYEFSNLKASQLFKQYLENVILPAIPNEGTVVIHGHTDFVGGENYDLKMFLNSTNDARKILEAALAKAGRTDVKFEAHGFGEDQTIMLDESDKSASQTYNRTVIIDIVPAKSN